MSYGAKPMMPLGSSLAEMATLELLGFDIRPPPSTDVKVTEYDSNNSGKPSLSDSRVNDASVCSCGEIYKKKLC